jgi:SAM-dependent methyltransferase
MTELLKVNVGCGYTPTPGFVNCDLVKHEGVDRAFDAQERWPFEDNSVGVITGYHMLEHLHDWAAFFSEAWRVLAPGGTMSLQVPYGASIDGFAERGHLTYWFPTSFAVLQPSYAEAVGNLQHRDRDMNVCFEVTFIAAVVTQHLFWLLWRPWRRWGLRVLWYLFGGHKELVVGLTALKNAEQIAQYVASHPASKGSWVPLCQAAWLNDWDPKKWRAIGEPAELVIFDRGVAVTTHLGKGGLTHG